MGEALGRAGASIEGEAGRRRARRRPSPVRDGARQALEAAGYVPEEREVVQRLAGCARSLAGLTPLDAEAGVNIEALYSDHDHQLILVVDDSTRAIGVRGVRRSAKRTGIEGFDVSPSGRRIGANAQRVYDALQLKQFAGSPHAGPNRSQGRRGMFDVRGLIVGRTSGWFPTSVVPGLAPRRFGPGHLLDREAYGAG
jgi:hypothetical protein